MMSSSRSYTSLSCLVSAWPQSLFSFIHGFRQEVVRERFDTQTTTSACYFSERLAPSNLKYLKTIFPKPFLALPQSSGVHQRMTSRILPFHFHLADNVLDLSSELSTLSIIHRAPSRPLGIPKYKHVLRVSLLGFLGRRLPCFRVSLHVRRKKMFETTRVSAEPQVPRFLTGLLISLSGAGGRNSIRFRNRFPFLFSFVGCFSSAFSGSLSAALPALLASVSSAERAAE